MAYEDNHRFYTGAIEEYGLCAQGVHWSSKHSQYKRFEALTHFIKKDLRFNNIVDVGCGFAEYYQYLKENQQLPKHYTGIDCEYEMISICKKRFPSQDFIQANVLSDSLIPADYYLCSGALNILNKQEFYQFIDKCFHASSKGFIFNFLKSDSYNYILPKEIILFCSKYDAEIIMKDDYLENDMTLFLKK